MNYPFYIGRFAANIPKLDDWKALLEDVKSYKKEFLDQLQMQDSQGEKPSSKFSFLKDMLTWHVPRSKAI